MSNAKSFGNTLLSGAAGAIGGGLGTAAISGITSLFGGSQAKKQRKLNEQAAELNYKYGEMAADNAFGRQMQMYERTQKDQSYAEQVKQMKEAGLSVGLMMSQGGGSGIGMGQTGSAPQGGGAGGQQGGRQAEQQMADMQALSLGIQMQKTKAETELIQKQAENLGAQTKTEDQKRQIFIDAMRETGRSQWLENLITQYKMEDTSGEGYKEGDVGASGSHRSFGEYSLMKGSTIDRETALAIAKAGAETRNAEALANLNEEKAQGYWQELLNATVNANASMIKANAVKLATEWGTGEYTNWKTWASMAVDVLGDLSGVIKSAATAAK